MNSFDDKAKEWDKPDRVKMASEIMQAMLLELKLNREMTIIDLGAGTGLIASELSKKVKKVIALDSSEGMLAILKDKILVKGLNNITTAVFDAEKDTPEKYHADIIISSMAMHHIKNTEEFAVKLYTMLNLEGKIAIADLEKEDGSFHGENAVGIMHNGFDMSELAKSFESAGFKEIKFTHAYTLQKTGREYKIFLMTGKK
ncbi:MAG: class I SAM-dependent methyltransferase [bacterium]